MNDINPLGTTVDKKKSPLMRTTAELGRWKHKVYAELGRWSRRYRIRFSDKRKHETKLNIARAQFLSSPKSMAFMHGDDTFALYRILGNDLPPRHVRGQTLSNLEFCLLNEPALDNCQKWWVVNRITDPDVQASIVALLRQYEQNFFVIDFNAQDYRSIGLDFSRFDEGFYNDQTLQTLEADQKQRVRLASLRLKNLYAMNNNGARNAAINHGHERAKWILPWDGNCILTKSGWHKVTGSIKQARRFPYHIVPMCRTTSNQRFLETGFVPTSNEEPQIIFHRHASERFNDDIPYGRRPKVELLMRLGVWGAWYGWRSDPWDFPLGERGPDWGKFALSDGWVGRLTSGNTHHETGRSARIERMISRDQAIIRALERLDTENNDAC